MSATSPRGYPDREFASGPWLRLMLDANIRFVLRWKKRQKLLDTWGETRKAWEITRGKRSWDYRHLRDTHTGERHKVGVVAVCVTHPEHPQPLWLVVARPGRHYEPWYLLTSDPIRTAEDAWAVVFAYARRWQIECAWRYSKSELAMESPRVWTWERREKLLLMVTLVYAFLLSLLASEWQELRSWLLRVWCHRTGKQSREVAAPLYRLRSALSRLWQAYLPSPGRLRLNSG
jgi:Transposase DDE domain